MYSRIISESFQGVKGIRWGDVTYKKIREVKENTIEIDQIPFIKRYPYRVEKEFRILWEGRTKQDNFEIDINLNSINKITISQNIPDDVYITIMDLLREKIEDTQRKILRSTLYENKTRIRAFRNK